MRHRQHEITLDAKWSTGQRTPTWDALWHRILADIAPLADDQHPGDAPLAFMRRTDAHDG